jgi:hypothetical protein
MQIKTLFTKFLKTSNRVEAIEERQIRIEEKLDKLIDLQEKQLAKDYCDLLLTEEDVMKKLKMGERWIRDRRKEGSLKFVRLTDKSIRYTTAQVDEFIKDRSIDTLNRKWK